MPYLSPRIFLPDQNDTIVDLTPLRMQMRAYEKTIAEPTGVYFEYLPSGSSISIDEDALFIEASLLKVPVAIETYKLKDEGFLSMDDTIQLEQGDKDPNFGSLWKRDVGTVLTVRDVVREMLQESDNTALQMLGRKLESVRPGFVNEVFDDLDIPKAMSAQGVMISAKNYVSILRSLYLASSLPKQDAQEVLAMLTETIFSDKLPAGVPADIPVAHKIGVFEKEGYSTYADCGIVYVPRRPYALCMFVLGSNDHATQYMQNFSRMAYDYIAQAKASRAN